ncbi:MAG: LPS export ABC transporter permease LptG [Syntrophobacteraceae bacterium]
MRIIPRYMLRHFWPVFAVVMLAFVGLYLVVDFFERLDAMMANKLPFLDICRYFLGKIPFIVTQGIPMSTLLATIITLGMLKRNRELIAMEAAGVKPAYYVAPIAATALLLSVFHFTVGEFVARPLSKNLEDPWNARIEQNKPTVRLKLQNVWYRAENTIYQARLYDWQNKVMERASIFFLDPQFRLTQRLDARRIVWTGHGWVAYDGLLVGFNPSSTDQQWFESRQLDLNITPADLEAGETVSENLGWIDLYNYIYKIEQEGFSSTPFRVDLQMRLAAPLATFILALLGIAVALRQGLHGGIAAGVGFSMGLAFAFLGISSVGKALASSGVLPPFLGVWAGNIVFAALACYSWVRGSA